MECKCCGKTMKVLTVFDTGSSGDMDFAYPLYGCDCCGSILKRDVWDYAGDTWVFPDNSVERIN